MRLPEITMQTRLKPPCGTLRSEQAELIASVYRAKEASRCTELSWKSARKVVAHVAGVEAKDSYAFGKTLRLRFDLFLATRREWINVCLDV